MIADTHIARRINQEEFANALTHGLGLVLSLAGLAVLVFFALRSGTAWQIVSCSVYGITLVLLYAASTLYHSLSSSRWKRIFQVIDHSAIYLLIAGTYTPFTLVLLRGGWGWTLFGLVWIFSLAGILLKVFFLGRFPILSTALYLAMGWIVVIAAKPMLQRIPGPGLLWLLAGGLAYTLGVVFFAWRRMPFHHAVWHGFVLAGSVCHYFAVLLYVLPART